MRLPLVSFLLISAATAVAAGQETAPILVLIATETPPDATPELLAPRAVASEGAVLGRAIPDVDDSFDPGWLGIGTSILLGTRPTEFGVEPTWLGGFDVAFRLDPHVALGIRRANFGMFGDERYWTLGASPFLEVGLRPWERIDIYGQVGAALGLRIRTRDLGTEGLDVAPFAGAGLRFYVAEVFSIAIEGVVHVPVLGGLSLGQAVAPLFAVTVQGGLALSFHFH